MQLRWPFALLFACAGVSVGETEQANRLIEGRSSVRQSWLEQVEQARQSSAAYIASRVDAFRLRNGRSATIDASSRADLRSYLDDTTLRFGDVIATDGGLLVFRGRPYGRHTPSDFEDVTQGKAIGKHETELRAIDRTLVKR